MNEDLSTSTTEELLLYETEAEAQEDDALFEHYQLEAAKGQGMLRIDKFIVNFRPQISRTKVQRAADLGFLFVNGTPVKSSYKVKPLDKVSLMLPFPPPPELKAEEIPLNIAYEDDYLLMVNKAADMVCHPSVGHYSGTLIHALLWHFEHLPQPANPQDYPRPGLVHRIDKGTSGLLVIAKEENALAHLSKQFFDKTTDRIYHAIVWGDVKADSGTITGHIARSPKDRKLFAVYADGSQGKHAITHYRVLERFGIATLVECKLETGRTHQIRVHFKHIGHPLFGDTFYGGDRQVYGPQTQKIKQFVQNCLELMPHQALHAKTLAFYHPHTGKRMEFDSEVAPAFQALLDKLRKYGGM